jgi:hypothetical protein
MNSNKYVWDRALKILKAQGVYAAAQYLCMRGVNLQNAHDWIFTSDRRLAIATAQYK